MNKYSYNYMMATREETNLEAFLGALAVFTGLILMVFVGYLI